MSLLKAAASLLTFLSFSQHGAVQGETLTEDKKSTKRAETASKAIQTPPLKPNAPFKRQSYPEQNPLVCLAFLSCCGRTNLLNNTLSGIIRHMEEDEPSGLAYEIAWVDNGSGEDLTDVIVESFEIEHALPLQKNMGLAFGMNVLIQNLCTAPYILLLEEDWLYLDDVVATQTEERKSAIARSLALLMTEPTALNGSKKIIGVQLRDTPNTIDGTWTNLDLPLPLTNKNDEENSKKHASIEYGVSCMELQKTGNVWGSFTNGAALYSRQSLINNVGRMYGEPTDFFHDAYVESNYAFRVGMKQYCTAAIAMEPKCTPSLQNINCNPSFYTSAFQHIGGGRGTRPRKKAEQKYCDDESWMFYGTDYYEKVKAQGVYQDCTASLPSIDKQLEYNLEFMKVNAELNTKQVEKEQKVREGMLKEVEIMRKYPPSVLRSSVPFFKESTDEQILNHIDKMEKQANSPHQIAGFWDKLGNIIERDDEL